MKSRVVVFSLLISLFAVSVHAHGNMQHVKGTVTQISNNSITVKTAANAVVTVMVVPETEFLKRDSPAKITDLQVGDRVVIHTMKDGDKLLAHTVKFGQTAKPPKSH